MTRALLRLTPTKQTLSVTLDFNADAVLILNPTAKTVCVRQGARDVPTNVENADYIIPPASAVQYPVMGSDFAIGTTLPQLAIQPDGMPTIVTIVFTANESLANLGSMALTTLQTEIINDPLNVTGTVNATVTGNVTATIPGTVNVSGNVNATIPGVVNASIQNANLNVAVTGSVNIPIMNASGDLLDSIIQENVVKLVRTEPGATGTGSATVVIPIPNDITAISLASIQSGISLMRVTGAVSGIQYFNEIDMRIYTRQKLFTFPIFAGIDTSLSVTYYRNVSTSATKFVMYGHYVTPARSTDERGAAIVSVINPVFDAADTAWYDDVSLAAAHAAPGLTRSSYIAPTNFVSTLKAVYLSMDGTTAAGGYRAIVNIYDNLALNLGRVLDFRSQVTNFSDTYYQTDLVLPAGYELRMTTIKSDLSIRRCTYFPYILQEPI